MRGDARARIRSSVIAGIATVVIGALAIAPMAPPPEPHAAPTVSRDVRLTGAGIIRNQFQYCSLICPSVLQGAITVPIATVQTPVTFLDSLASTGSPLKAIGAAAASVTGPANAAVTPLINNDVFLVVPKAFHAFDVAIVEAFNSIIVGRQQDWYSHHDFGNRQDRPPHHGDVGDGAHRRRSELVRM